MDEHLVSLAVLRLADGTFACSLNSRAEGEKEILAGDLDDLMRQLSMDLEYLIGDEDLMDPEEEHADEEFEEEFF